MSSSRYVHNQVTLSEGRRSHRFAFVHAIIICCLSLSLASAPVSGYAHSPFLSETFEDLDRWEALKFDSIPRHSEYRIARGEGGDRYLAMLSERAASGLLLKDSFDPRDFPIVEWRWRVDEAITGVKHERKSGDDYPLRIYVFFEYDGTGLGFRDRLRYRAYRALRGEYPPHSALTYVWTANPVAERVFANPHTDRVKMLVLRGEEAELGKWAMERVNIMEDYQKVFGEAPPNTPLRIAIMTDSDDTGQQTRAALDWLRILAE